MWIITSPVLLNLEAAYCNNFGLKTSSSETFFNLYRQDIQVSVQGAEKTYPDQLEHQQPLITFLIL